STLSELSAHLRALAESPVSWITIIPLTFAVVGVARVTPASHTNQNGQDSLQRRLVGLLLAYFCLATGLALLSGSRAGSNINYFIEPLGVGSLAIGAAGSK